MARKYPTGKNGSKKKASDKKNEPQSSIKQAGGAILLILTLVVSLAIVTRIYIDPRPSPKAPVVHRQKPASGLSVTVKAPDSTTTKKTAPIQTSRSARHYEIFPKQDIPPKPITQDRPLPHRPKIAIIIDDIGYDQQAAKRLMTLGIPITLSVLPYAPHAQDIAKTARSRRTELMLHLPMEPIQYPQIDPGKGALLASMDPDTLIATTNMDLARIPGIKGVNNHMGSRMTSLSDRMNQIFTVLKKNQLFFIDSRTTSKSVCAASARLFQVPFAQRDVFFDHVKSESHVNRQFDKLLKQAEKNGYAVGIGHPYGVTLRMLEARIPYLKKRYDWVFASKLVHPVL